MIPTEKNGPVNRRTFDDIDYTHAGDAILMLLEKGRCAYAHGAPQTVADKLRGRKRRGESVRIAFAHQKGRCGLHVREDSPDEIDEVLSEDIRIEIFLPRI